MMCVVTIPATTSCYKRREPTCIGRGLKSAAKKIGDEIPKIGPAIGDTFKESHGQGGQGEGTEEVVSAEIQGQE
jgi:hypothetical protein